MADGDPQTLESVGLLSWVGGFPWRRIIHSPLGVIGSWLLRILGMLCGTGELELPFKMEAVAQSALEAPQDPIPLC